jgi:dTDP-4-dehydrorhamnose reductase
MRILILGKNGMLGKDLIKTFDHEDFIAFGKEDLDLTEREDVFEKFMTVEPDVVINATGYTDVDKSEKEPEMANEINGYAVGIMAQACREIDATFIHFSSDYVFKGNKMNGYNEEDQPAPVNAYGSSKALGEHLIMEEMEMLNEANRREGKFFIIRTSWLFGKHGKNFVDTIIEKAKKSTELKVINDQFGKPTYTMDLAKQVQWLLGTHDYPFGIYHVTNEGVASWYDLAKEALKIKGINTKLIPCSSEDYPTLAVRPKNSALNNTMLPTLRSWQEALNEYLN